MPFAPGHDGWVLLNPGPACTSPRVRNALLRGDLCHREPEVSHLLLRKGAHVAQPLQVRSEVSSRVVALGGHVSRVAVCQYTGKVVDSSSGRAAC